MKISDFNFVLETAPKEEKEAIVVKKLVEKIPVAPLLKSNIHNLSGDKYLIKQLKNGVFLAQCIENNTVNVKIKKTLIKTKKPTIILTKNLNFEN